MNDKSFPMLGNESVCRMAAETMAPNVMRWLEEDGGSREDFLADVIRILSKTYVSDGYEIAKTFEDYGYRPDSRLVQILESFSMRKHDALMKARKEWVKENGWKTDLKAGDKVTFPEVVNCYGETLGKWFDGVVSKVKEDEGVINVQKGDSWNGGTDGFIIPHTHVKRRES